MSEVGKYRQDHGDTSHESAAAIAPSITLLQTFIYNDLWFNGPATDQELQDRLRIAENTERPRRVELVEKGMVEDSGERRKTRSGRNAKVWRVVE